MKIMHLKGGRGDGTLDFSEDAHQVQDRAKKIIPHVLNIWNFDNPSRA